MTVTLPDTVPPPAAGVLVHVRVNVVLAAIFGIVTGVALLAARYPLPCHSTLPWEFDRTHEFATIELGFVTTHDRAVDPPLVTPEGVAVREIEGAGVASRLAEQDAEPTEFAHIHEIGSPPAVGKRGTGDAGVKLPVTQNVPGHEVTDDANT